MNFASLRLLDVDDRGAVLVVGLDGGPHALFGIDMANEIDTFLDIVEKRPAVRSVIFTGKHPDRFISHADVAWLQKGGRSIPRVGPGTASAIAKTANATRKVGPLALAASVTPLGGGMQLDKLHDTFMRMNRSGVIFIAALNGSALGLGSEFAQANDVRLMADRDIVIGQPEVLLGINPGGGGTQRLTRLVGAHRALMMMLEGRPVGPDKALQIGLVDEVVAPDNLIARALELAEYLGSRPSSATAAIKRTVYIGGSMSLEDGLHQERTEFIMSAPSADGQSLMKDYLDQTERTGTLPFYDPEIFAETLKRGRLPKSGDRK